MPQRRVMLRWARSRQPTNSKSACEVEDSGTVV